METRSALIFGASGMVGNELLHLLISHPAYDSIISLARREIDFEHPKLKQIKVDFDTLDSHQSHFANQDVYCCLGTTIKKAKSKEDFRKIDFSYVTKIASLAAKNKVENFAVISSLGVTDKPKGLYLKTKAEMEAVVKKFNFKRCFILRPSLLLGNRTEKRMGEQLAKILIQLFSPLLFGRLKKYRGVNGQKVAKKMIELMLQNEKGIFIIESDVINT